MVQGLGRLTMTDADALGVALKKALGDVVKEVRDSGRLTDSPPYIDTIPPPKPKPPKDAG